MRPSGPGSTGTPRPTAGGGPGPSRSRTPCSCRKCQLRNTSSSSATWKFTWHRPGRSPWNTASLWCTSSMRIRHAASPIQSETRVLNSVDQNAVGLGDVGGVEAEVAELGDARPGARPHRTGEGAAGRDELDAVAERVVEAEEARRPAASGRLGRGAARDREPAALQLGLRQRERGGVGHGERRGDARPETPSTNARQWCRGRRAGGRRRARRASTCSRPTTSTANRTAPARSAAPERT